ncbi:MAG TPA: malonyl-ACP O-methyltransferase BioC [Desulfitobacteriaceae bacterium]|nr:malonyl-ACP O-methyltransferase BioC [Desulfitobacteriaceae bacterium]
MVNKTQVQQNFGRHAVTYDQYAIVQKEMAQELLAIIRKTERHFRNILEIGCGTGILTELLAAEYPEAQITATDIAPEMISVAKDKLASFSNITYFTADGENLTALRNMVGSELQFDLIVSNVVFQWFSDYAAAFAQFYSLLEEGGYLMFSTLGSGTFKELYVCLRDKRKHKSHSVEGCRNENSKDECPKKEPFIRNKCLLELMTNTGFQQTGVAETAKQEYFGSCRDFLKSLKMIGAHNYLSEELAAGGLGSGIFSLIKNYDSRFSGEKGVPATYRCLYGWGLRAT